MEECPDGKQHFISPNLPATAKTALFGVKDGRMPGGNYYCHVCTGNTGLHRIFLPQALYTTSPPQKSINKFINRRHSRQQ